MYNSRKHDFNKQNDNETYNSYAYCVQHDFLKFAIYKQI